LNNIIEIKFNNLIRGKGKFSKIKKKRAYGIAHFPFPS